MAEKATKEPARQDAAEGKAPTTQAGEFVRDEIKHIPEGKHGARPAKQAIAIGLSKARRAGVRLPPRPNGQVSPKARTQAQREYRQGQTPARGTTRRRRSRGISRALKREGSQAVSQNALARHARGSARRRGSVSLRRAATKAVRTKGRVGLGRVTSAPLFPVALAADNRPAFLPPVRRS